MYQSMRWDNVTVAEKRQMTNEKKTKITRVMWMDIELGTAGTHEFIGDTVYDAVAKGDVISVTATPRQVGDRIYENIVSLVGGSHGSIGERSGPSDIPSVLGDDEPSKKRSRRTAA